ncbi:MAG TPA: rhomboid family intramembrane serine protease [Desulfobulbus sp.]|nr:rhomboid family intramembrane serine protease [Desulfobulbus sp.]
MKESSDSPGKGHLVVPIERGDPDDLETWSLVLSAVGIPHVIDPEQGLLLVAAADARAAADHIRAFREENRDWPPPPYQPPPGPAAGDPPTLLAMGSLAVFYLLTGPWTPGNPWFLIGAIDSRAILEQHQWWRLVTALTLHADPVHLLGNCLIGGLMVHLLCRALGHGTGWLLLITTGATGNFLNIAFRGQEHYSVGFSTAVFAAIGCFSSLQAGTGRRNMIRQLLVSVGAGAALLAMLGTSGERTDLGAHLFGFLSGLAAGALVRPSGLLGLAADRNLQGMLFLLAQAVVVGCWLLAWRLGNAP